MKIHALCQEKFLLIHVKNKHKVDTFRDTCENKYNDQDWPVIHDASIIIFFLIISSTRRFLSTGPFNKTYYNPKLKI